MKKIIFAFCILILAVIVSVSAFASDEYYRLQDIAELLTESENARITEKLDTVSEKYDMDIAILTVDSIDEGLTVSQDAMEWYEYLGFDTDGVMLYVNMSEGEWYLLTSGYGITAITDAGIEYISDKFVDDLSNGYYADAFETFIEYTDSFIHQAKTDVPYDTGNMPKEPYNWVLCIAVSVVIGFVISFVINNKWKKQLNSVALKHSAQNYVREGSFNLTSSRDLFLYNIVDKRKKPEKSSGGSSITKSSSGRSYGGRGGKF